MSSALGAVLPDSVNYAKQRKQAAPSYSRRVKSIATNAQSFGENQYANITLDTSVPGSNLDPLTAYLKFDVTIINQNPFIDYMSFGSCGVAAFFEEFRIICQGTPIEEILNYPRVYELFMDLCGECKQPYSMYRSCKVSQNVDQKFHVNAIKPPMVSQNGDPMYYQAAFNSQINNSSCWVLSSPNGSTIQNKPYLLGTSAAGVSFHKYIVTGGSLGFSTNLAKANIITQSSLNAQVKAPSTDILSSNTNAQYIVNLYTSAPNVLDKSVADANANSTSMSLIPPFDLPAILLGRMQNNESPGAIAQYGAFWSQSSAVQSNTAVVTQNANSPGANSTNCFPSGISQPGTTFDYTDGQVLSYKGIPPATTLFGSTCYFFKSKNGSNATISSDSDPTNPFNWPYVMPNDTFIGERVKPPVNNIQDYFTSFFNVKNIPIGLQGQDRGSSSLKGQSTYVPSGSTVKSSLNFINVDPISSTKTKSTTFTVQLPLLSGILGSMAAKMFPTMLGAPGSTFIQLKTAPASVALQVSMDPCRVVLGTIRDYIKFGGSLGGVYGQFSYLNPFGSSTSTDANNNKTSMAFVNSLISNLMYLPAGASPTTGQGQNITYTPTISNSYFGVSSGASILGASTYDVTDKYLIGSCFACIGANLLPFQTYLANETGSQAATPFDLVFSPYSTAAMEGKWTTYDKVDEKVCTQYLNTVSTFQNTLNEPVPADQSLATPFTNLGSLITVGQSQATSIYQSSFGSMNASYPNLNVDDGNYALPTVSQVNTGIGPQASNQLIPQWSQNVLNGYTVQTDPDTNLATSAAQVWASGGLGGLNQVIELSKYVGTAATQNPTNIAYINGSAPGGSSLRSISYTPMHMPSPGCTFSSSSGRNVLLSINPSGAIGMKDNLVNYEGFPTGTMPNPNDTVVPGPVFLQSNGDFASNNSYWNAPGQLQNLMEVTVCGHPSGIPLPQWVLGKTPWYKKSLFTGLTSTNTYSIWGDTVGPSDLCSETEACYGTYLPASVAQSLRCFNQLNGSTKYVNYAISNLEFVSQQVILPEQVAADVLSLAETEEGISISTNTVRVVQSPVQSSSTQNIIIPAKFASANAGYIIFVPQNHFSTTEGQLYNSNSRLCPFSQISSVDATPQTSCTQSTSIINKASYSSGQYALGQGTPFNVINAPTKSGSFQIQMVLGNDYIPIQPITCISEIVSEISKCQHKLFDVAANTAFDFSLTDKKGYVSSQQTTVSTTTTYQDTDPSTALYYSCFDERGFCSAFTFPAFLDDQTYIGNPNWNYVGACIWNASATYTGSGQSGQSGATNLLYGARGPYTLPFFTPLENTFCLGFDLDSWSGFSELSRSGTFLGSNTITLRITEAPGLDYANNTKFTGLVGINMYAIFVIDLRLSFQAGGTIVPYF